MAVVTAILAAACGGGSSSGLATDDGPSVEPGPSSTSVAATLPTLTTSASSPSATVPLPVQPLHLEGSDDTLHVTADLNNVVPPAGQGVRVRVKVVDRTSIDAINVFFGDGSTGGMIGPPSVSCSGRPGTTTTTSPRNHESIEQHLHAYRVSGRYRLHVEVFTAGCLFSNHVTLTGTVTVGPGIERSNGPLLPTVTARQATSETSPDPNTVVLSVGARDSDGYLTDVTVKWGDGTEEPKRYSLADCEDPETYYPRSSEQFTLRHAYPATGSYEVVVVVSSSGCDGKHVQAASKTVAVTAEA
jgi:hypothetical protein